MNIHLKVKICTLAAEAKIIRQQERRLTRFNKLDGEVYHIKYKLELIESHSTDEERKELTIQLRIKKKLLRSKIAVVKTGLVWPSIHDHRRGIVRWEARHNQLAYAFLRNKTYVQLERKCYTKPDWEKVLRIVKRFAQNIDERDIQQRFEEWVQNGKRDQDRLQGPKSQVAAE